MPEERSVKKILRKSGKFNGIVFLTIHGMEIQFSFRRIPNTALNGQCQYIMLVDLKELVKAGTKCFSSTPWWLIP